MMFDTTVRRVGVLLPGLLWLLMALAGTAVAQGDDEPLAVSDIRICNLRGNTFAVTWRTNQATSDNFIKLGFSPGELTEVREDQLAPPSHIHYVETGLLFKDSTYYFVVSSEGVEGASSPAGYDSVITRQQSLPSAGAFIQGSVFDSKSGDPLRSIIVRSFYRWTRGTTVDSTMWVADLTNADGEFIFDMGNYRRYNISLPDYVPGNTWLFLEILSQTAGKIATDSVLLTFPVNELGKYQTLAPYEVVDERIVAKNGRVTATGPVISNGKSASVVNVTVLDEDNNPLPNVAVELLVGHDRGVRIIQPQTTTDRNGRAWGLVFSEVAEIKTISVINVTSPNPLDHLPLDSTATVQFVTKLAADPAQDTVAPFIYFTTILDHTQNNTQPYKVIANAVDNFFMDLDLVYRINDDAFTDSIRMIHPVTADSAHIYDGAIPPQSFGTLVSYLVLATDSAGNRASKPDNIHLGGPSVVPYMFQVVEDTGDLFPKMGITLTTDATTTTNGSLPVRIDSWIHGNEEIRAVVLKFRNAAANSNYTDLQMDNFGAHYWAEIPPHGAGSQLEYFVQVTDAKGEAERDRFRAPDIIPPYSYNVVSIGDLGSIEFVDTTDQLGITTTTNPSRASAVADFDVDGAMDVVVANYGGINKAYYYKQGQGFEDVTAVSLGGQDNNYTTHVTVADVNADDFLDLIFANEGEQNRLLINNKFGQFDDMTFELVEGTERTYMPEDDWGTNCIVTADFDGDGDMDLYVANGKNGGEFNRLLFNDGKGVFYDSTSTKLHNEPPSQSVWAIVADVDNDEDPDVMVINRAGEHYWMRNSGRGVLDYVSLPTGSSPNARSGDMADVDGDNDLDLVVGQSDLTQNELYLNDGKGIFTADISGRLPAESDETFGVRFFDANTDGFLDLLYLNRGKKNSLLINNKLGFFEEPPVGLMPNWSSNSFHATVADFNNDNRVDLFIAEEHRKNTLLFSRNYDPNAADQPSRFNLLAPADGDTVNTTSVEFAWNASVAADSTEVLKYNFMLSLDSLFSSNVVGSKDNLTDTTYTHGPLTDNTRYWWKVLVKGNSGYPVSSLQTHSFVLMTTHQGKGPEFFVLINRNPVFSGHVTAYIIASEPLLTNPTVAFNNEQVAAVSVSGGTIFRSHYVTRSSFLLTISGLNLSGVVGEYSSTFSSTLASSTLASRAVTPDRRAWIELPASSDMLRLLASTNPPVPEGKLKVAVGALEGVTDLDLRSMVAVESYTFTAMEGGIGRGAKIFIDGTDVEEPGRMSVCRLEQQGWQVLPTVFDPETDQFSASAGQDGTFALLAFGTGSSQLPRAGKFNLGQNSPNPFNPSTFISFSVPGDEPVEGFSLKVFNVRGQVVAMLIKGTVRPGNHTVQWTGKADNGRDLSSGVYFYRLSAPGTSITRKMVLLR